MPGTDLAEAAAIVLGELPDFPHLPELPARGVGADMLGRTAALLVDLAVEVVPTGYRVTRGRDSTIGARSTCCAGISMLSRRPRNGPGSAAGAQDPGRWAMDPGGGHRIAGATGCSPTGERCGSSAYSLARGSGRCRSLN